MGHAHALIRKGRGLRVEGGQVSIKYSNHDTNPTVHYRLMDASKYDSVALVNAKILSV